MAARVLVAALCVGVAGQILASLFSGGTQTPASFAGLMEAAFGPNGLTDGELTPPLNDGRPSQQRQ